MPRSASPPSLPPSAAALWQRASDFTRDQPAQAAFSGLALSVLLHVLPIRALGAAVFRLFGLLLRPALLALGLWKAGEIYRRYAPPAPKP